MTAVSIDTQTVMQVARATALEEASLRFAAIDPVEAEATIDAFVAGAIAAWRLEDATYWQRVKFRARLIRTMRRNGAEPSGAEANYLPAWARVTVPDESI